MLTWFYDHTGQVFSVQLKDSIFLSFLCYILATPLKILCKISPCHFSSMIATISGSCIINTRKAHICPVSCTQNISEQKWRLYSTYAGSSFPVQMWELEETEMCPGWTSRISEEDILLELRSREQTLQKVHGVFLKQTKSCTGIQQTMGHFQSKIYSVNMCMTLNPSEVDCISARLITAGLQQSQLGVKELTFNWVKSSWKQIHKYPQI